VSGKNHFLVTSTIRFDALEANGGPLDEIERLEGQIRLGLRQSPRRSA
jgi:hypothetical protein